MTTSDYIQTEQFKDFLFIEEKELEDFECHNCSAKDVCQWAYDKVCIDGCVIG